MTGPPAGRGQEKFDNGAQSGAAGECLAWDGMGAEEGFPAGCSVRSASREGAGGGRVWLVRLMEEVSRRLPSGVTKQPIYDGAPDLTFCQASRKNRMRSFTPTTAICQR